MKTSSLAGLLAAALLAVPASAQTPAGSEASARRVALGHLDNAEASLRAGKVAAAGNSLENAETTLLNQEVLAHPGDAAKPGPLPEQGVLRQVTAARTALAADHSATARKDAQVAIKALRTSLLQTEQPK